MHIFSLSVSLYFNWSIFFLSLSFCLNVSYFSSNFFPILQSCLCFFVYVSFSVKLYWFCMSFHLFYLFCLNVFLHVLLFVVMSLSMSLFLSYCLSPCPSLCHDVSSQCPCLHVSLLSPCVPVTVLDFGTFSRNYTDFRKNKKMIILVYFVSGFGNRNVLVVRYTYQKCLPKIPKYLVLF